MGEDGKSRELAVLLANRSAVLFSLKAYGMALDDIELAFRLGYPDDLAYKLHDRRAKCLVAFKQMEDAGEAYRWDPPGGCRDISSIIYNIYTIYVGWRSSTWTRRPSSAGTVRSR